MKRLKRFVRSMLHFGIFTALVWSASDEEKARLAEMQEEVEEDDEVDDDVMERDAAYLTTGLITAARSVVKAHEAGESCRPHHEAAISLLASIEDGAVAIRVIQHLLDIVAQSITDEDVQQMVASIVATELGDDEGDLHHH